MPEKDVYEKLGEHLSTLGMGYPYRDDLIDILKENFSPLEAEAALAIPTGVLPLQPVSVDEIHRSSTLPREELTEALKSLAERRLLFTGKTEGGETGYALHQVGYGFPQTFFWEGKDTPHSKKMARLIGKYFNRSHGAVIGSADSVRSLMDVDTVYREEMEAILNPAETLRFLNICSPLWENLDD